VEAAVSGRRAIVFDLDGVVLDSERAIRASVDDAMALIGEAPVDDVEIRSMIGPAIADGFAGVLAGRESDRSKVPELEATYRDSYRTHGPMDTRCFDGILAVLEVLTVDPRVVLGAATSKPRQSTELILAALELDRFFPAVGAPELSDTAEPKAEILSRVLDRLRGDPGLADSGHCMVGDRHQDMAAAIANGIRPVGVAWGYGSLDELVEAGASVVLDRPEDLVGLAED
jgi:phosphoglycolate phosphatase